MLPLMAEEIDEQEHGGRKQEEAIELVSALMFIERSGEERLFRLSLIERVEDIDIAHFGHSGGRWFVRRSEEHTSELQSLIRISYAVFCLKKKNDDIERKQECAHVKYATMLYSPILHKLNR